MWIVSPIAMRRRIYTCFIHTQYTFLDRNYIHTIEKIYDLKNIVRKRKQGFLIFV